LVSSILWARGRGIQGSVERGKRKTGRRSISLAVGTFGASNQLGVIKPRDELTAGERGKEKKAKTFVGQGKRHYKRRSACPS